MSQIFSRTKLKVCFIPQYSTGRHEIIQWIRENVPEVEVRPLVFRHDDFGLSGYRGEICIVGNSEGLTKFIEKFNSKWTDGHGNSIDPRFCLEDRREIIKKICQYESL